MLLADFKKAKIEGMKAHDNVTVDALNVVINKLMLLSIDKRSKGEELTEADTVAVLQKTEKELIEERDGYERAGRQDTVDKLNAQLAVIKAYLPKMMTEEEIASVIATLDDKSVPSVMRHFKQHYQGKCDMRLVSQVLNKK